MPNVSMRKFSAMKLQRTLSSWDQLTKHFNAFHIFHTICIGRDLLPKPTKRVAALDSLARLVANANTTAKSTGGAALLVPIRRCAAQLWQLCGAVRSTQGGSRPSGTDATRSNDGQKKCFRRGKHRRTIDHKHIVIVCLGLHTINIQACTPVGNLNPKEETSFADDAPGFRLSPHRGESNVRAQNLCCLQVSPSTL